MGHKLSREDTQAKGKRRGALLKADLFTAKANGPETSEMLEEFGPLHEFPSQPRKI